MEWISALATLMTAIFTGLLWRVSKQQAHHHLHHHLPRPQVPHLHLGHPARHGGADELGLLGPGEPPPQALLGQAGLPQAGLEAGPIPGAGRR
jgi:hypothetical protein